MKNLVQTILEVRDNIALSICHINIRSLSRSKLLAIQTSFMILFAKTELMVKGEWWLFMLEKTLHISSVRNSL